VKASTKSVIPGVVHGENSNNEIFRDEVFKILTMKKVTSSKNIH
jgi:hypothetical protein